VDGREDAAIEGLAVGRAGGSKRRVPGREVEPARSQVSRLDLAEQCANAGIAV